MGKSHLSPKPDEDDIKDGVPLMKSPLRAPSLKQVAEAAPIETLGWQEDSDLPDFERHEEATNIEVFYDLFFAANLCVYFENRDITTIEQLSNFVAYFTLLWFNWAALGLFDVRFVTDSIFERCLRAVHFGVSVGFAVVVPQFDLHDQKAQAFRTFSIILMVSRMALAIQYASVLVHVRKWKSPRVPLGVMVLLHVVTGFIYLGVAFGFTDGNGKLYLSWYVITAVETSLNIAFSLTWQTLSFDGTHLAHRMSLLTYFLMGEGVLTVLSSVARVVVNGNAWTSPTIGNVAAGVATIYIVYQIYYDWRPLRRLKPGRKLVWSFLHFPFHLAMKLFILGFTQFIIWWKILETNSMVFYKFMDSLKSMDDPTFNATTEYYVDQLRTTVLDVFAVYKPKYQDSIDSIDLALQEISSMNISEEWWRAAATMDEDSEDPTLKEVVAATLNLLKALINSLLATFNVNGLSSVPEGFNGTHAELNQIAWDANLGRFHLVLTYTFVTAGISLILMNVFFIVSRPRGWTPFNCIRKVITSLIGVGLCLVALVGLDPEKSQKFNNTPWPLPTLCLALFFVLVLNHLPHPPPLFFEKIELSGPNRTKSWDVIQTLGFRNANHPRNKAMENARKKDGQALAYESPVGLPQPYSGHGAENDLEYQGAAAGDLGDLGNGDRALYHRQHDSDPDSETYLAYTEVIVYQGATYQGQMVPPATGGSPYNGYHGQGP
ncbi:hypothetical protein QBC42DRAFT_301019 [Cladorrhinum samala]|uniref:Low temperature requirement A n=1 Tax=Cladorrhinum samala TaxID=585594 RepID=A0AAV9HDI9_9PEZI|nr:hypothetical protein QBC42DRAFT_301019 [Cladorrhinum samala]